MGTCGCLFLFSGGPTKKGTQLVRILYCVIPQKSRGQDGHYSSSRNHGSVEKWDVSKI